MNVDSIIRKLHNLPKDEYVDFMKAVHVTYPLRSTEITNKITNYWKTQGKKQKENSSGSSGQESKPRSSLPQPEPWQKSAWKSGLIFRGDKIPNNGRLYLDVEKVTIKKQFSGKDGGYSSKHFSGAATICIVNQDGKVILWAFIKIDHDKICKYSRQITNLDERKLGSGVTLSVVHDCLKMCLPGNTLIGADLENDLKALEFEKKEIPFQTFDLQTVYRDEKGAMSLGLIASQLFANRSGFQAGHHSAIDDARMTLAVHNFYEKSVKEGNFWSCLNKLSLARENYKASKPKVYFENCKCVVE